MNLLCDELDRPQDRFDSIHVVGTNGKSSVSRMTAAIVTAHGHRSGCSLSPHVNHWSERVLIDGSQIDPESFARAVARTATAAETVNAGLEDGDVVTQFELATAASFLALAGAGVAVQAWSPLGRRHQVTSAPAVSAAATAHGVSPAQVVLRWAVQQGIAVVPRSARPGRQRANLDLFGFALSEAELAALDGLDRGEQEAEDSDLRVQT